MTDKPYWVMCDKDNEECEGCNHIAGLKCDCECHKQAKEQATRETNAEWEQKIDDFPKFSDREIMIQTIRDKYDREGLLETGEWVDRDYFVFIEAIKMFQKYLKECNENCTSIIHDHFRKGDKE